uniref:Serine and arginine rich splicing factor 6 n=1 Tax=Gadus morhua TaxID=8049 RepID=A0A8C5CI64_GADMO
MPRVYIGRLGPRVREKDVQRFFGGYGKLMEIDLKNGFGFVEFDDNRDADDAVYELNGRDLCGERVVVEYARGSRRDLDGGGRSNLGVEGFYRFINTWQAALAFKCLHDRMKCELFLYWLIYPSW